jgi:hypothetical protein
MGASVDRDGGVFCRSIVGRGFSAIAVQTPRTCAKHERDGAVPGPVVITPSDRAMFVDQFPRPAMDRLPPIDIAQRFGKVPQEPRSVSV